MKKSSRELQLSIIAIGASVDEILNNYCALFSDLTVAGHRVVEYGLLGKTFNCYYQSQSDLSLTDMRLNSEICMMEFTINLKTIKNELKDILSQVLNYETISTSCPIRTDGARLEFATEILKIPGLNHYPKLVYYR